MMVEAINSAPLIVVVALPRARWEMLHKSVVLQILVV